MEQVSVGFWGINTNLEARSPQEYYYKPEAPIMVDSGYNMTLGLDAWNTVSGSSSVDVCRDHTRGQGIL